MSVDSQRLAQVLLNLTSDSSNKNAFKSFIEFLKRNNLMMLLPQIRNHVERFAQKQGDENILYIASPFKLKAADVKKITSIAGASSKDPVETIVDESMTGGFQATYQGRIYDGSLDTQITRLRHTLTN